MYQSYLLLFTLISLDHRYGTSRTSTRDFYVHHTQRIALAAKQYDAKAIRKSLCGRKQKLIGRAAGGAP